MAIDLATEEELGAMVFRGIGAARMEALAATCRLRIRQQDGA